MVTTGDSKIWAGIVLPISNGGTGMLKVYLVKHNHGHRDYYYNSFMVVASNETLARSTHPPSSRGISDHPSGDSTRWGEDDWVPFNEYRELTVQEVGTANDDQVAGVLLAAHY